MKSPRGMTAHQLAAAIRSSHATAARHEASGRYADAATARARATRNTEELRRRAGYMREAAAPDAAEAIAVLEALEAEVNEARIAEEAPAEASSAPPQAAVALATRDGRSQARPEAQAGPQIPNAVVPDDAVRDAEEIARKWGSAALVRACVQVLNTRTSYTESMDITEAPRVIEMRRRVSA